MGEVVFTDNSIQIKDIMNDAVVAWLYEASGELQARVMRNSPVDNGQLKGSWEYHVDEGDLEATIGSPLENAVWNEFGTGNYALHGDGRKTPWYVATDGYLGTKKPSYGGSVVIVHGKKGKDYFKTDGKKPQRSFHNAYESCRTKIVKNFQKKFGEVFK